MKWIVVGLGNPGAKYAADRHNIGFQVVNALCQRAGGTWRESQYQSLLAKVACGSSDQEALLVQPMTYMNLSGQAIAPLCQFYQLDPSQVLVVHDDLELPFGRVMLKKGGGESGHRGLLSVTDSLETRGYLRLRFGIGRPPSPDIEIPDYVLSPFSEEEELLLPELIAHCADAVECCCEEGESRAMNLFNKRKR